MHGFEDYPLATHIKGCNLGCGECFTCVLCAGSLNKAQVSYTLPLVQVKKKVGLCKDRGHAVKQALRLELKHCVSTFEKNAGACICEQVLREISRLVAVDLDLIGPFFFFFFVSHLAHLVLPVLLFLSYKSPPIPALLQTLSLPSSSSLSSLLMLLLLLLLLQWQVLLSLCFLMLCFLRRMLQEEAPESTARTWHAAAALFSPRSVYHIHDKTTASEALALELTMGSHNKLALPDMALGSSSLTDNVEGTHVEEDEADYTSSSSSSSSSMHVEEEARPADGSSCIARELPSVQIEDEKGPDCAVLEQAKLPSSHYKGVVPQPNGRWGAQIYEKHQRVWLGTFNMEHDAAKAYDRAALKFRGRDAMTNFKPAGEEDIETAFLRSHAKEQVVDMLRRHTYDEELDQTKKLAAMTGDVRSVAMISAAAACRGASEQAAPKEAMANKAGGSRCDLQRELLFEKAVTPSDVGKLNRLVIPKQHAERCFPLSGDGSEKGLLLNFEDFTGKMWRFRYSYWNSSQSYVLTKGWSRFVKEMKLDAGDIVVFEKGSDDQLHISCRRRPSAQHALLDVTLLNLHHPAAAAAGLQRAMASPSPPWQYLPYHHHPSWQLPQQLDQCRPHQNMQQQQQPWQPQISAPASPWLQLPHSAKQPPDNNNSAVSLAMVNSDSSKEGVRPHGLRLFGVNLSPCKEDFEPSMASGCSEEVKRKRSNLSPNDSMSQNDDRKLDKAKRFKEEGPSDLQA